MESMQAEKLKRNRILSRNLKDYAHERLWKKLKANPSIGC